MYGRTTKRFLTGFVAVWQRNLKHSGFTWGHFNNFFLRIFLPMFWHWLLAQVYKLGYFLSYHIIWSSVGLMFFIFELLKNENQYSPLIILEHYSALFYFHLFIYLPCANKMEHSCADGLRWQKSIKFWKDIRLHVIWQGIRKKLIFFLFWSVLVSFCSGLPPPCWVVQPDAVFICCPWRW